MKSNKVFFIIGLVLACVAAVMFFASPSESPKDSISFASRSINKGDFSTQYHKGKPLVVNYWATWCPPCVKEIPHFVEAQEKYKGKVQFVGISLDDSSRPVGPFIKKHNINYPIVMSSRVIAEQFGSIKSIPTTFILDKDHNIVDVAIGYRDLDYLSSILDPLL